MVSIAWNTSSGEKACWVPLVAMVGEPRLDSRDPYSKQVRRWSDGIEAVSVAASALLPSASRRCSRYKWTRVVG